MVSTPLTAEDLELERIQSLIQQIQISKERLEELAGLAIDRKKKLETQIGDYALSIRTTKLKPEELDNFFKKPYVLRPATKRRGEETDSWFLIIPKFIDAQFGWLEESTDSYNLFRVNRYVDWIGDLPAEIKRQLGWKPPLPIELEGELLKGPKDALDEAQKRYGLYVKARTEKGIVINPRKAFELISTMIKDGILPFTPQPIPQEDRIETETDIVLRDYQKEAWKTFLEYGNVGVFYPPSVGKTYLGLWALTHIKGPHLVVVPTITLREQWEDRILVHTKLKPGVDVNVITYHSAVKKFGGKPLSILLVDECHHFPADEFAKMALLTKKYTIGLSASPQREDGREHYIFALTGKPIGLGWDHFRTLGLIRSPVCHVWIVKNGEAKMPVLRSLLSKERKTIIFCDSIALGKKIADDLEIPHVHGATKERLKTIENNKVTVVSRVGDEGISIPAIEMVVEVSWLEGSRRQELQRMGRLLHSQSENEGEHNIIMTLEEYAHDRKRLYSLMDKGFKVELHKEGVSEETLAKRIRSPFTPRRTIPKIETTEAGVQQSSPSESGGLLGTPGIQRMIAQMNKGEEKVFRVLVQYDGTPFTSEKLALLAGYAGPAAMRASISLPKMVERGWIDSVRNGREILYKTSFRSKLG